MMQSLAVNNVFQTTEFALASALLCLGYRLDSIAKGSPKSTFVFERIEGLDEAIQGFWAGELRVEPKSFFACQREIKARLYSGD